MDFQLSFGDGANQTRLPSIHKGLTKPLSISLLIGFNDQKNEIASNPVL